MKSEPQFLELEISKIEFPDYNPRMISKRDFKELQNDIKKDPNFLKQRPPLINRSGSRLICYAGTQRAKAAQENGSATIHCWVEDNVPEQLQHERMLKDNLHRGEWDFEKLKVFDASFLNDTGFRFNELGPLFTDKNKVREDVFRIEEEIEKIKKPKTKPGDIYKLGEHRLMCGNSESIIDVEKLMGNDKADIIYCDPPYNIGLSYDKGVKPQNIKKRYTEKIFSDNKTNSAYQGWVTNVIMNAKSVSKKDNHIFFWCDPRFIGIIQDAFRMAGFGNKSVCFWIKNSFNPVTNMAFNRIVEPVVYGTMGKPYLNGTEKSYAEVLNQEITGRNVFESIMEICDAWTVSRDFVNEYIHPTQKPVTLHEKPLKRCSVPGNVVIDLFGGSGSTLIACEQMGRKARLMELDPTFCDAIVNRWERFAGNKAELSVS